jgi:hypothetical protein
MRDARGRPGLIQYTQIVSRPVTKASTEVLYIHMKEPAYETMAAHGLGDMGSDVSSRGILRICAALNRAFELNTLDHLR